jgi:hypothetical protein
VSNLIIRYEMQKTANNLDRRIRELELIVAVYSVVLRLHKEKKRCCPTPSTSTDTHPSTRRFSA